ncbi:unnamed protein product [Leptidea sinapis]|uniref:Rad50/SbcC-type AAA domain-containing protein n=1 Tax=Leptidea sinapis TaxID=189913 RepID=A0A5E4QXY2_9NEOP|nr:unnamed protein product [Leptidea sinapis]
MESDNVEESDDFEEIDGSIHSVHVRNFFCHDNLEINFNRNVNFIVGRNGSGKSAILTALVVGLGGRASATNRGNNLHSFIKKGANSATVEIKIRNSSPRAYKHDVYGDYITIVRNITASGGSSYKVKSASGEVISTKFEEVHSIILTHDIQVDNPISVLNQDDARSFHASDAKKKYSLFRKATNLDQTESNYTNALENCKKAIAIWNRKNESCKELEKEYKKWKALHDQMQSRDEIESEKQRLQNEYYWSEIAEFEKEASTFQTQSEKQRARCQKLMEKLRSMEDNYGNDNSAIESLKKTLTECNKQKRLLEQDLQEVESSLRELQLTNRNKQGKTNKLAELLAREKRKLVDLEREIENIESGNAASQRAGLEKVARDASEAAAAARARYETQQNDMEQARAHAAMLQPQRDRAVTIASQHRDKLKHLRQQLRELESRGSDSLAVYGSKMVELCQKVQAAHRRGEFSAPPKGPIGHYLKVKDKKWGGALEHIIGGSIQMFCTNTWEDTRKLISIMGKVYGSSSKPGVTCSKFLSKVHDVSRNTVRARGFTSSLDALDIADPVVANFLIDNVGMEKILLVPEHNDAMRLADTVENVPEHCSKIVTVDGSEYLPAPNYRCYGGSARPPRFLHLSTAERKRQVQAEIKEEEATLRTCEAKAEELNEEAMRARDMEREAAKALQSLLIVLHQREEAAREAAATLDHEDAPHHNVLMEELQRSKETVRAMSERMTSHSEEETSHRALVAEHQEKISKLQSDVDRLAQTCRNYSEEIEQEQLKLERGVTERQTCEQRLREEQRKLEQLEGILQEKQELIDRKVQEALTLCPRVENARQNNCNKPVEEDSNETIVAVDHESQSRRGDGAPIKITADKHLKFCHQVQTYIARRGRMEIECSRGTLDIVCTGRESSAARHAASTSSLSGGERSYSTVAFMMALWDCSRQFVFLTPQDASAVTANEHISIHVMADPRP